MVEMAEIAPNVAKKPRREGRCILTEGPALLEHQLYESIDQHFEGAHALPGSGAKRDSGTGAY